MSDQQKQLHPDVSQFKTFINEHPKLIHEIRKHGRSWQEYYEKWVLLGAEDPFWEPYRQSEEPVKDKKESKMELFSHVMKLTENVDLDKLHKQVQQFNETITTLQELLDQFQQTKKHLPNMQRRPNWFKD